MPHPPLTPTWHPDGRFANLLAGDVQIPLVRGTPLDGGLHRILLRCRDDGAWTSLLDPAHPLTFTPLEPGALWSGAWRDLHYRVRFRLHPEHPWWSWSVQIRNAGDRARTLDLLFGQDVGLATEAALLINEIYVCHYLDHTVLDTGAGPAVMTRQNEALPDGRHPWLLTGLLEGARSFGTDGRQFFGLDARETGVPICIARGLPGAVLQDELAYPALQSADITLPPGAAAGFTVLHRFEPDHPAPSGERDRPLWDQLAAWGRTLPPLPESAPAPAATTRPHRIARARPRAGDPLRPADLDRFFPERLLEETEDGTLHAFFTPDHRYISLLARERRQLRASGHLLRSGPPDQQDESVLCATVGSHGVFGSQITLGNPNFHRITPVVRNDGNQRPSTGLRLLIRDSDRWERLTTPSAFEQDLRSARWWFRLGETLLCVSADIGARKPELAWQIEILEGPPRPVCLTLDLAMAAEDECRDTPLPLDRTPNGALHLSPRPGSLWQQHLPEARITLAPTPDGALRAAGGADRIDAPTDAPLAGWETNPVDRFALTLTAHTSPAPARPATSPHAAPWTWDAGDRIDLQRIAATVPWYAHNATVHYTAPHGLEQSNGGAWGVRDVCQGPVEYLLACGRTDEVARILLEVFTRQSPDTGKWPQWFMRGPYAHIQQDHCHGDIIFWPLKALCDYIEWTGDTAFLHTPSTPPHTLLEGVRRAWDTIRHDCIPGTALPRYGDGDWNDTLQPLHPDMRTRMGSAWTAALAFQTLTRLSLVCRRAGEDTLADDLARFTTRLRHDFRERLMPDGIVCGFRIEDTPPRYLLHPRDRDTRIRYRLLSFNRAILAGLLTPAEARRHLALLRDHLLFPDGAHLMDRALPYAGGVSTLFRRAETAACFGREISLQYVHAHLRTAEALAALGEADDAWRALLAVTPPRLRDTVPNAAPRQANVYFSSSDGDLPTRLAAAEHYARLRTGDIPVKGGWRLYSSGPGLYLGLLAHRLIGLRQSWGRIILDPVLPQSLEGATAHGPILGHKIRVTFQSLDKTDTPPRCRLNGRDLPPPHPVDSPYRGPAWQWPQQTWQDALRDGHNHLELLPPA